MNHGLILADREPRQTTQDQVRFDLVRRVKQRGELFATAAGDDEPRRHA